MRKSRVTSYTLPDVLEGHITAKKCPLVRKLPSVRSGRWIRTNRKCFIAAQILDQAFKGSLLVAS
jgi:hypothetical protein